MHQAPTLPRTDIGSFLEADSAELRIAHEFAVMLARLRGVNARVFRDERTAVAWLEADPPMN